MAAPSTTVWGNIVTESTSAAKIGIYTALSSTNTQTNVTIQVWIASKWSLVDSDYTLCFNNGATSATTVIPDSSLPNINVTVATGSGWSDSNQVLLYTYTKTYDRTTTAKTISCAAKLSGINRFSGKTMTVTASYKVPALVSYSVSYVANGGSGAPSAQVKWYGKTLTLSSTKPTRTGYTFLGWSTSQTATTATYAAGASFTANANTNLYAVWKANTYTVSYNANGGTGAPSNQTKTYGVNLTLSSTIPTRTNYNFLGWGTSATATTATYSAGGSYTANAAITLYAIWSLSYTKPRITNFTVARSDSGGVLSETGTYFKIAFNWATDKTVSSVYVYWKKTTDTIWNSSAISSSGTSGSVSTVLGSGSLSTESTYDIKVTVTDANDNTSASKILGGLSYLIDFKKNGDGVAIGKSAETNNLFDVKYPTLIRGQLDIGDNKKILLTETSEGGNIRIYAPDEYGNYYEMDAHNGDFRIYTYDSNNNLKTLYFTRDGLLKVGTIPITGNSIARKGANTITSTANDTVTNWGEQDTSVHYYNKLDQIVDQPNQYAFLLNIGQENNVHQLWLSQPSGDVFHRGGNANGWSGTWRTFLDSSNYSKYAVSKTEDATITGIIKIDRTLATIGYYRFYGEWIGFYASTADAMNNANRKGWIGYDGTTNFTINNGAGGNNVTNKAWTTSSDRRMKTDVIDAPDVFVEIWSELQPKIFHWNDLNGSDPKYHFGLIAQDVIDAFEKYNLDYKDYGFVNSFTLQDDNTEYFGIAYDEYHMLTSLVTRKQQEKINSLEERIEKLEKLILGQEE